MTWAETLEQGDFHKDGLERLNQTNYGYPVLGLGGTTLRVGPHGFTAPGAPSVLAPGALEYWPYLAYEYWWGEDSHRREPFEITGGYDAASAQVWSFETAGNTEGWTALADTVVSQDTGALVLTYVNDSGDGTENLSAPGAAVSFPTSAFQGSDHGYLYIEYECVNWPTSDPVWCNMGYETGAGMGYGHFQIDPTQDHVVIDMHSAWDSVHWGPDWSISAIEAQY